MIEIEYHTAFLMPSALDLLLFKKKLTVTGISGKTHGVIIANNPVPKQIRKILQSDLLEGAFGAEGSLFVMGGTFTEKLSCPLGNSAPDFASHAKLPLIFLTDVSCICSKY
jgi:hypothetical protein